MGKNEQRRQNNKKKRRSEESAWKVEEQDGEWSYQGYHDSTADIGVAIENSKRIDKISNKLIKS